MVRSVSVALFAMIAFAPAAALAQSPPPAEPKPAETAAPEAAEPNRKICRTVKPTGYRLRKTRLCATASEWEQRKFDDRQGTTKLQNGRKLEDVS